jgi:ComF family protein
VGLLDLVLPPRCGGCRALGSWLCERCRAGIRRLQEPLCPRCGAEVESLAACPCRGRLRALRRLRAAAAYEGPLERAIHRFKYERWRALARPLASLLEDRLAVDGPAAACLVAVPLHPARRAARGYNQSELIARELARSLRLDLPLRGLRRVRDTPPQVGLDRLRRHHNVAGAFSWHGPPLQGEAVLLVDDVATTGATLEACARALRAAGSGSVTGMTLARVRI